VYLSKESNESNEESNNYSISGIIIIFVVKYRNRNINIHLCVKLIAPKNNTVILSNFVLWVRSFVLGSQIFIFERHKIKK